MAMFTMNTVIITTTKSAMYSTFTSDPKVIENFNLLQQIGVFDEIDTQQKRVADLEELLRQATQVFSKTTLESLLEYVVDCISDKFIPEKLVFILQDRSRNIKYYGFRNLRPYDYAIELSSLEEFESFFVKYPQTIQFELFEFQFERPDITDKFKFFNPEIVVPIVGLNGLYGIILVGSKILEPHYSDEEIHYLDRLMSFTSISIQNNIHYLSAVTDAKTHLYNHTFFMKRLSEEIAVARDFDHGLGVIVLDIDNFKHFNDRYGHLAGDLVIKRIASVLSHALRRSDLAARFGGEEFTVMLPRTNRQQTWAIAERLRLSISEQEIIYQGQKLAVTASLGCSAIHPLNQVDGERIIDQADTALYESKRSGRNRTSVYRPGLLVSATMIRDLGSVSLVPGPASGGTPATRISDESAQRHEDPAVPVLPNLSGPENAAVHDDPDSPVQQLDGGNGSAEVEEGIGTANGIWDHCPG
jgi:diguanylate cyclase (GGDEF)-like protein